MPVDLSVFDRQKSIVDQQQLQQAFELKKAAAIADLQKVASGGDMPAPIKVANRMFELQQIATNPALPEADRRAANTQYNLLGQSAKTFGFDRGIEYNMQPQFPALPPVEQQGSVGAKPRDSKMPMYTPPQGEDMAIDAGEYIDLPQSPQGTDFSQFPDLQPIKTPQFAQNIQPIGGYGSAVGNIAATKAGMEEQAKQNVKIDTAAEIERQKMIGKGEISPIEKKDKAKAGVTRNLNTIAGYYNQLDELGAGVSPERDILSNIGARAGSTTVGQIVGRTIGSEEQTIRDNINQMRPTLMSDIRQATEMGAKGLDSEKELEFYLQAVSNPSRSLESNRAALAVLNDAYGLGSGVKASPEEIEALRAEFERNISGSQPPAQAGQGAPITATGANGQKLQLVNGQWQPI